MLGTWKCANTMIPLVSGHETVKGFPWKKVHDLRKQCFPGIHPILSAPKVCQEAILTDLRSSLGYPMCAVTYRIQ